MIDKADQIKKVPTFVIEEEARIERGRLAEHFEEESVDEDEEPPYSSMYGKRGAPVGQSYGSSLSK